MRKKLKPNQRESILTELKDALDEYSGPIAIGLDMAAQESEWGVCVLVLDEDLAKAKLCTLLPQAKLNQNHTRSPTLFFRPDFELFKEILATVYVAKRPGSLAVDTPFGWPRKQLEFLTGWSASCGWSPPEDDAMSTLPNEPEFARRRCDLALKNEFLKKNGIDPLAIGADKIALASVKWAHSRLKMPSEYLGDIDLGLGDCKSIFQTFETYPGAFVKLVASEFGDYKTNDYVRNRLLTTLQGMYTIDLGENGEENLGWACNQNGSPDAYDSFLAALTAWDHLRWRSNKESIKLTSPGELLGVHLSDEIISEIRHEGWILIRTQ